MDINWSNYLYEIGYKIGGNTGIFYKQIKNKLQGNILIFYAYIPR